MTVRRWLVGIFVGCLVAVLIAPSTRWLFLAQVEQLIPFSQAQAIRLLPAPDEIREPARAAAQRTPGDFKLQLAAVCLGYAGEARVDPLRSLIDRFPDNPSLRASIIRFRCIKQVMGTGRIEETQISSQGKGGSGKPGARPTAECIAVFEEDCRAGEELDADNAFFPFMRSVVQFADGRDDEAIESIQRASTKPDWREYLYDEPVGEIALLEQIYGRQSAISRSGVLASVLLPHYAPLRSASRMALVKAKESEAAGDRARGIAIRHSLVSLGGILRARGQTAITNLVGIAITRLAISLRNGIEPRDGSKETNAEREERRTAEYANYVKGQGRTDEAAWIRRQMDADVATRAILNPFPADIIKMIVGLGIYWLGCMFLLSNSLWLALAAGAGQLAGRLKSVRAGKRLPWPMAALFILVIALAGSAVGLQTARIAQTLRYLTALTAESPVSEQPQIAILCGIAVSPLGLMALSAVVMALALRWRVPVSVALVRAYRGLALPIAGAIFVGYLALMMVTANREHEVEYYNQRWVDHEGRYAAELKNMAWIDVVK